ncbi:hypothetical protein EDB86DRAFT_3054111 [Lactarius hatsudake]|nr:hypothetical protein EDB86DRAFT_3054111 [Lactarius hatsudake]
MPAISFQAILDKALADYRYQIGIELDKHPFADQLRGRDSPDDVLKLLEDKASAFRVYRDGNRKLINWLSPVVRVIHTLSEVLGETVPMQPAKAIFVGVNVLITAAGGVSSSYDALVDLFECLENFLKRLRIYTDVPLTPSMTDIIGNIMVELLSVFALATKQIGEGRFKKFAKKLLGESEIEAVLRRLDRLTQEEGRMTVAQTLEVVHGLMNNVKVVMSDGKASTEGIRNALDSMQRMASDMNKMRRDQMQRDSKTWLCPPDPSKNYNIGCKSHRDGTAAWLFEESVFTEWDAKGSLLWIQGKPGSGKTILLSSIIRKIDSACKAGLASMAYYYFDFKDIEKQHLRGLLSSLVFQLSAKSDPCYQILSRLYSDHVAGTQEPSEDTLSQCLVEMFEVPGHPAMYIIIDALDECPNISGIPTAREQVLKFLKHLVELRLPNVHICVSSRPEIDIRNTFEPLAPFCMSLHDEGGQKADITSYIKAAVHFDLRMRRWRDEDKQLVINTLSNKADGMFRWVFCQLEVLRQTLPADIRSTLNDMPKTLDETYERALLAIGTQVRQYAQRLFQCLSVSIRPLRVEELADILAVRFDPGVLPKFNPDWRLGHPEEAVFSVCSGLISVVDVDGFRVVQFSHFSVKEFLTSDRLATAREDLSGYHIVPHSAHTILAQASLSVLLRLDDHIDKDTIKGFPLSDYAARHWIDHG